LISLLLTGEARAGEPVETALRLEWNAPAECPARSAVTSEVQRILDANAARRATARADIAQLGTERWQVHLATEVDGVAGERILEASSCASLASATALILAWILDPTRVRPSETPEQTREETSGPSTTTVPKANSVPRTRVRAVAAVEGVADVGLLPRAGAAIEVAVGAAIDSFRIEAAGTDWFAQDAVDGRGEGTHIHLVEGALRGCFRWNATERVELDPCGGAGLVYATSDGFGETVPFLGRTSTWGTVHALGLAGVRIASAISARASLGGFVPFSRPPFVLLDAHGGQTVLHQPTVSARATLGLEVRFP
jgi:hypothetical protein